MSSKKRQDQYTAGLVSKPFWFYEYKAYVNELLNGSSADEIRSSAFEKHLFSAAKEYRVKEILNCVSRRVTQFDQDWQELFRTAICYGAENDGSAVYYGRRQNFSSPSCTEYTVIS